MKILYLLSVFLLYMDTGFAFIYMEDERDAEDAIRGLDRVEFGRKGRRLRVEWTKVIMLHFLTGLNGDVFLTFSYMCSSYASFKNWLVVIDAIL